jgi:hypothetical protein
MRRWVGLALLMLSACGGSSAADHAADASAGGGTSGGGGTTGSGGTAATGGSFGTDAAACVPVGSACDGTTPCCAGQCENGLCSSALACATTIADYCTGHACVTSWPQDETAFCPILLDSVFVQIGTCNGYLVASDQGVDTGYDYYFDPATGALIAVVRHFQADSSCLAGPSSFAEPTCSDDSSADCSDAGSPSDAGAD